MSSTSHWALSHTEETSRDLVAPVRARLTALCADAKAHALFLNTLSFLEHIGSRKIMASQTRPGYETLKHLAEETRHAFFFKRAAEKFSGQSLSYDEGSTPAWSSAAMYMGRLDAYIARRLGETDNTCAYLYMSLIVELRAIWFYRLYQDVLAANNSVLTLKSVLAEEELHLENMEADLRGRDADIVSRTRAFSDYENTRFRVLWRALDGGLSYDAPTMAASGS